VNKVVASAREAVADIPDGATLLIGGFGVVQSWPTSLLEALRQHGARALPVVSNTPRVGPTSPQVLAEAGQVRKLIASYALYPKQRTPMDAGIRSGSITLELIPQGTLIERIRAAGAGLAAFYTPTGVDTDVARDREVREFDGRRYVLETALRGDYALIRASRADRYGNLVYRRGSRNFNPVMATGARVTIAEVDEIVETGRKRGAKRNAEARVAGSGSSVPLRPGMTRIRVGLRPERQCPAVSTVRGPISVPVHRAFPRYSR